MRGVMVLLGLALGAGSALAEPVLVSDQNGSPIANAVVAIEGAAPLPADFGMPLRMDQQNIEFHPFVLAVPVGAEVEFPNLDRVRHHVYSFAKGNRFELQLYGREEHRTVKFEKAGLAAIGCNIHDNMLAYIYVADTPFAAVSGEDGMAEIKDLPLDTVRATVWHPALANGQAIDVDLAKEDGQFILKVPAALSGAH